MILSSCTRHFLPLFTSLVGLSCVIAFPLAAQTDDDVPASPPTVKGTPADEALWKKLDINDDDWLDGNELDGGWIRFDEDDSTEVTRDEWMRGRARERRQKLQTQAKTTYKIAPRKVAAPKTRPKLAKRPVAASKIPPRMVKPVSVARRAGFIVGRAIKENGAPVPAFTVDYSGFEDGKLANSFMNGALIETVNSSQKASGGRYAVKVPRGAYRASAYVTYSFRGRVYHFPLELSGTPKYDYQGLGLEKLRGGLVRNFVLKMTGKKPGASEATETVYRNAYYGGTVELDALQYEGIIGGGNTLSTPLRNAYPPESQILLTLSPAGTRVDGSKNYPVNASFRLGDDGKWTFMQRGIFPGLYSATAKLRLPTGEIKPLRLALKPSNTISGAETRVVFPRQSAVTVDFLPNDLGPAPRMGVKAVRLYLGE
ncbi:MAG TPA: hypothetical protein VGB45_16320 [Abditibacterium sp.]|jgi:hypothetical protein